MFDLILKNISKTFQEKSVLENFSLELQKAELCCLLGPSGCGKSTTLKVIAGFLVPDHGTVQLNGQDITRYAPQKRHVGLVFQNYALFPHLNVLDNVSYGLRRRKLAKTKIKKKVAEILELVQLTGFENRKIHELSGGQQQRVALARSLVTEPNLLLLDEPLSNLDAQLRTHMRVEIARIQKRLNLTMIYVTHDQDEAMSIADRVVVMNQGKIEQIGTPRNIYENPASTFVASFIGKINLIQARLTKKGLDIFGITVAFPDNTQDNGKITCAIRPEKIFLKNENSAAIPATINSMTYLGSLVHYTLKIKDREEELLVEVPGPQAHYQVDESVSFDISEQDIKIFRDI